MSAPAMKVRPGADQQHRFDACVGLGLGHRRDQPFAHRLGQRIDRRRIEGDDGDLTVACEIGDGIDFGHGFSGWKACRSGLSAAQDQGVHIMRALIGIHRFQIQHMADHGIGIGHAIGAQHVARFAGDRQRLAAIVALHQRDQGRRGGAVIHHAPQPERAVQPQRDFGLHVGQLLLHQLGGGQGPAELLALQRILPRHVPAGFRRADRAPGDAEAGAVEAGEGRAQALGARQHRLRRYRDILQHDFAGDAGAQREFSFDARGGEAFGRRAPPESRECRRQAWPRSAPHRRQANW